MTIDLRGYRKLYLLLIPALLFGVLAWTSLPASGSASAAAPEPVAVVPSQPKAADQTLTRQAPAAQVVAKPVPAVQASTAPPAGLPFEASLVEKVYVTCRFRDPQQPQHSGLDFPLDAGTPVLSTQAGTVLVAEFDPVYGYLVVIGNRQWQTRYAHNATILVQSGQTVTAGQPIALVGSSGESSGPHLHYEVRDARETARDPENYLDTNLLHYSICK